MSAHRKFKFSMNWKLTLCCAFLFPILLYLGKWQLDRAGVKATILENWRAQQEKPALTVVSLKQLSNKGSNYRRVKIQGVLDSKRYWLVENKIVNGQIGAYLVVPFLTKADEIIAVNLGWIALPRKRDEFPDVTLPSGEISISGMLIMPTSSAFIDEAKNIQTSWPHKVLEIDLTQMSQQLGTDIFSMVLQIDADNVAAKYVNWKPINVSVDKHIGYAVQWFCMAGVLFILWLIANSNVIAFIKQRVITN